MGKSMEMLMRMSTKNTRLKVVLYYMALIVFWDCKAKILLDMEIKYGK